MSKRTTIGLYLLVFPALLLAACSPAAVPAQSTTAATATVGTSQSATSTPSAATTELNTSYQNAVSIEEQLLLGTLQLAGTDQAVTKEQAALLIPLWTQLQSLSQNTTPGQNNNDTTNNDTTQADALVQQIITAMTPAQIQAIAAMQITSDSAMTLMQELGVSRGGPGQGNGQGNGDNGNPPQQPSGNPPDNGNGGEPPSDGNGRQAPGDGQQPGNGQQGNDQQAMPQNGQNPSDGRMMVSPQLIDALLQMLNKISAGEAMMPATGLSSTFTIYQTDTATN